MNSVENFANTGAALQPLEMVTQAAPVSCFWAAFNGAGAAFVANWEDKAVNIRNMADQLSLGMDSFVFLDDNPVERAWVRSQLPQVAVVNILIW